MRRFIDTETDDIITIEELEQEYNELKASGDTEAETFTQYVSNCMYWNNGTLKEI